MNTLTSFCCVALLLAGVSLLGCGGGGGADTPTPKEQIKKEVSKDVTDANAESELEAIEALPAE